MDLDEVEAETARLSNWAHLATVGADGKPDVVPVWPAWQDDTLWIFTGTDSVKVRNLASNPHVALHWQVDESGDGVEVWGTATVHTDVDTKRRLWTGVFTYNLDDFAPGGIESADHCVVAVKPERALVLKQYGRPAASRGNPRRADRVGCRHRRETPALRSSTSSRNAGVPGWAGHCSTPR